MPPHVKDEYGYEKVNFEDEETFEHALNLYKPKKYNREVYTKENQYRLAKESGLNKHQKKFDYFHLGPIFVTQSHPNENTIKEKNISYISRKLSNVIFVGGININNVSKLLKYNFSGIAIMRELLLSRSPEKTFMELREKINE